MAEHVCPVWVGRLLASPLRKLFQNPKRILGPYLKEDMKTLDVGCAMGFFSLPMARMVGPRGGVICVDLQEKMITSLRERAQKAGLADRIEARVCDANSLGLEDLNGKIDFTLAFAVVHEVPDAQNLFGEILATLKPGGRLLVAEPSGRVSEEDFKTTFSIARQAGFKGIANPRIRRCRAALLSKGS
jgi:ubiquinone/menaquinone biosynthesis C-methylase UbiE